MRRRIGIIAGLILLAILLIPRNTGEQREQPDETNLSAQQELNVKQALVTADVAETDALCRSQCALHLGHAADTLSQLTETEDMTKKLAELQKSHPHMKRLLYIPATPEAGTEGQEIAVGEAPQDVLDKASSYVEKAKEACANGENYQSPAIFTEAGPYFVMAVSDQSGSLIGLVHQAILQQVEDHQTKNLRVVPYPAESNWKIQSVDTDTLQDVTVDHPEENEGTSHYHKNQVVVKFIGPPTEAELQQIQAEINGAPAQKLGYTYVFQSTNMEAQQLMEYFKKWQIQYAEPHYLYLTNEGEASWESTSTALTPNDALYSRYQWNLPLIETLQGWEIGKGSQDIKVAVVDTGVDLDHPDLQGHLLEGFNVVSEGKALPYDDVGHGTHVAGVISAVVNNGEGVAGMTWHNPILPVKVLDASGSGSTYAVAQGIIWAADNGAKVINMSLGNYADAQFLHDAIKYAFEKDVVLIAASGNDNTERPGYPAAYDEVFAVAATDSNKNKASFSNYGDYIDVAAPGVNIPSTYPNNQYAALSGTSMASPHVSALAALIRSANPLLKNTEVMDIMRRSATDIGEPGKDKHFGYGLIDVVGALQMANEGRQSVSFFQEWLKRELEQITGRYEP